AKVCRERLRIVVPHSRRSGIPSANVRNVALTAPKAMQISTSNNAGGDSRTSVAERAQFARPCPAFATKSIGASHAAQRWFLSVAASSRFPDGLQQGRLLERLQ